MENNTNITVNSEELKEAFEGDVVKKPKVNKTAKKDSNPKRGLTDKKLLVFLIVGII